MQEVGNSQIYIIAVDGADWRIIDSMFQQGKLPNIKRTAGSGVRARLASLEPFISPVVWTSIFSGKLPQKHGVKDFFATGNAVRCQRIWDILEKRGYRVGIFEAMCTWPPKSIHGFCIPDTFARDTQTFPRELEFIKRLNALEKSDSSRDPFQYLIDGVKMNRFGVGFLNLASAMAFLAKDKIFSKTDFQHTFFYKRMLKARIFSDFFLRLCSQYCTNLSIFYTNLIDVASHMYWKYYESEKFVEVGNKVSSRYAKYIPQAYEEVDRIVGKITNLAKPEDHIVVLSDHGFRAIQDDPQWESYRIRTEFLLKRLKLWDELNPAYIGSRLFLKPKQEAPEKFNNVIKRIRLLTVHRCGKVFPLFNAELDHESYIRVELQISKPTDWIGEQVSLPDGTTCRFEDIIQSAGCQISGTHDRYGILMLKGPAFKDGAVLDAASILDVTPTLLYLAGLPVARDMDGTVLQAAFREQFIRDHSIPFIDSYEDGTQTSPSVQDSVNEDVVRKLKDLGYI